MLLTSFSIVSLHIRDFTEVSNIPSKKAKLRLFPAEWPVIIPTIDDAEPQTTVRCGP